ncbi:AMP-binding protein [Streptomyces sp. NPDC097619]|uniref:non-ribosomal peptide synthetase n=1 Tax=Streptomyces sp. NPDC097619 TaxID=3157228 RepID=UPI003322FB48
MIEASAAPAAPTSGSAPPGPRSAEAPETWRPPEARVPDAPGYHLHRAYTVTGEFDPEALRTAWREVTTRHEVLRAAPAGPGGAPAARLGVGPGRTGHLVTLRLHQALGDERSLSVLMSELSARYEAAAFGRPLPDELLLPAPQYADFAALRRLQEPSAHQRRLLDWWVGHLTPLPAEPALPVDRARPPGTATLGGTLRFDWGPDLAGRLADLCRAEETTPYTVLLAALLAVLSRQTGEDRLTVGVPSSLRPAGTRFADVIGPFRNHLVLLGDLSGNPSFRELLARVGRSVRAAREHRELPYGMLTRALNADGGRPHRIPLCDVMFVYEDTAAGELWLPGAVVRRRPADDATARTDLTLTIQQAVSSLEGSLEYRAALFERGSAEAVLRQLRTLLTAALAAPGSPVADLELADPERTRAVVRAADLRAASPGGPPVHVAVRAAALTAPGSAALAGAGTAASYGELQERAEAVAHGLRALGVAPGDPVAVRMANGPGRTAALLGAFAVGGYAVCLAPEKAGERGRDVLDGVRPVCLLSDPPPAGAEEDELVAWFRRERGGTVFVPSELPPARPPVAGSSVEFPVHADPDAWAYVTHTSGSTGIPKGIPQTHRTLAQLAGWFADEFGIGPGSRVAQWASPSYDASLVELFAGLAAGATVVPVPDRIRAHPEKLADWLEQERITLFQTVPSFARELLAVASPAGGPRRFPALDHLLLAGEPLPGELAGGLRAALPGVRLVNLYGATETVLATWHEVTGPVTGTVPVGRPIPGRQVLVLDDSDRPCPPGVTGRIVVTGPHITPGYVGGDPADPAGRTAFRPLAGTADRCYRAGDLGRWRWDGALEFRGRGDTRIKFYGVRMELTDIEAALAAHESVTDCAVVAHTGADGLVSRLVAYVVPARTAEDAAPVSPAVWRAFLRRRFGKSMLPVAFRTLDGLPRNAGGKVDRRALAALP